jgi:hypothetical protein
MFERRVGSYFHLTTWRREDITLNSVLWPRWDVSTYWSAQENIEAQAKAAASMFTAMNTGLIRFDQLSIEALGRAKAEAQLGKERLFERIRQAEFPASPSRRTCVFLCESEAQLREYIGIHRAARVSYGWPMHRGDRDARRR